MGLIAELLEWVRGEDGDAQIAEGKVDPGGGDVLTAVDYTPAGFDGQPVPGDYVLLAPGPEAGSYVMVGYVDPKNAGTARAGEVSLYLRDGNGAVQGELYLAQSAPQWKSTAGALLARADKVDQELADFAQAYANHVHETTATVGGTGPVGEISPTTQTYIPETTACEKVWGT